jgi:peptide/nickel transport system permease protein
VRSALRDALEQDYTRTARAKGVPPVRVVVKHAGKNAAIPVVTTLGLQIGTLFGSAVIAERIFNIPGLGTLVVDSVLLRDISMVQGIVLVTGSLIILVNLVVDLSYGYFNPRIRG